MPKRFLLFLALSLVAVSPAFAEQITADDSRVQIEGRTASGEDGMVRAAFPAVTFRVRVDAARVTLRCRALRDMVHLDVAVDGAGYERHSLDEGENELVLYDGPAGAHNIEVVKRTEAWQGELVALSFDAGDGRFLEPDPLRERRLMFIGDSITCGEGTDIREGDPPRGPHTSNGRLSFGTVLAERLGAQCHLVSYGGRGALRTWQGKQWPEDINAPQFYGRALPDESDSTWDASRYVPDAVVICLGTNDFNLGAPDEAAFVGAYQGLIRAVRRDAPEAWVLVVDSPMYGPGEKGDTLRRYLDRVVEGIDDERVQRASLGWYKGRPVDSHPVASEHDAIADELEPVLRDRLGW